MSLFFCHCRMAMMGCMVKDGMVSVFEGIRAEGENVRNPYLIFN